MAETTRASDKSLGLSITFGVVAVVATVAMVGTSYQYALTDSHQMKIYAAVAFGAAMLAGSLAVAVLHMFGD